MPELSSGARVRVSNPRIDVATTSPGYIKGLILREGPTGPAGGPIPTGGDPGEVPTPDGLGGYTWRTPEQVGGLAGEMVGTTDSQTLTNKDLSDPSNAFPSSLATDDEVSGAVSMHSSQTSGVHGVSGDVVGTTSTQTLTNKTLTSPSISNPSITESSGWTTYTPTWGGTVGNGTIEAAYKKIGRTVTYRIRLVMGSTTTYGSGPWTFSLPVATTMAAQAVMGCCGMRDTSASGVPTNGGFAVANNSTTVAVMNVTGGLISASSPFTWASGDILSIYGSYESTS